LFVVLKTAVQENRTNKGSFTLILQKGTVEMGKFCLCGTHINNNNNNNNKKKNPHLAFPSRFLQIESPKKQKQKQKSFFWIIQKQKSSTSLENTPRFLRYADSLTG